MMFKTSGTTGKTREKSNQRLKYAVCGMYIGIVGIANNGICPNFYDICFKISI